MSKDISLIRKELSNCEEIELPFTFPAKCWIKYITLLDNDEVFYTGGEYSSLGHHKIYLTNKSKKWCVPTQYLSDDGEILYKSRFFIDTKKTKELNNYNDIKEQDKIIKTQQDIIDKMTLKIQELENALINNKSEVYTHMSELESKDKTINELIKREKKYKLILSQKSLLK